MGRMEDHTFKVSFILTGSKYSEVNPTLYDLKIVAERLGLKVSLPTSLGDPTLMEYNEPLPFTLPVYKDSVDRKAMAAKYKGKSKK